MEADLVWLDPPKRERPEPEVRDADEEEAAGLLEDDLGIVV